MMTSEEVLKINGFVSDAKYSVRLLVEWIDEGNIELESQECTFTVEEVTLIALAIHKRFRLEFNLLLCSHDGKRVICNNQRIVAMIYMYYKNIFCEKFDVKDIKTISTFQKYTIKKDDKELNIGMIDKDTDLRANEIKSFASEEVKVLVTDREDVTKTIKEYFKLIKGGTLPCNKEK